MSTLEFNINENEEYSKLILDNMDLITSEHVPVFTNKFRCIDVDDVHRNLLHRTYTDDIVGYINDVVIDNGVVKKLYVHVDNKHVPHDVAMELRSKYQKLIALATVTVRDNGSSTKLTGFVLA